MGCAWRNFTRTANWADRFPSIVEAAVSLKAHSFLIDGEVVIAGEDGMSDFRGLRSKRRDPEALLYAFDLLQHDGADLRDLPLHERKQRLAKLLDRVNGTPSSSLSIWRKTAHRVQARLPHGARGHRVEADGCALSQRTVQDVAQVEEPGERGGAPGA